MHTLAATVASETYPPSPFFFFWVLVANNQKKAVGK